MLAHRTIYTAPCSGRLRYRGGEKFKRIKINESMYPNRALGGNFTWSSGAWGWFLSNPVAKAYAEAWPSFQKTHDAEHCYCPDLVTGEILTLLGFTITAMPRRYGSGFQGPRPEHTIGVTDIMERAHYHYLSPRMMLAAHWRALHEKLDRMIAAGDFVGIRRWQEVVSAPIHLRMTHLVPAMHSISERHVLQSKRCLPTIHARRTSRRTTNG